MEQIRVLIFPCGSEIGLELYRALKDIRFIDLYGASSVEDHGQWVFKNYIGDIPYVTDPECINILNRCIDENHIDCIFPAMDSVISELSSRRSELHAMLMTSCDDAVQVCRSKLKTYKRLEGCDFLPKIYFNIDEIKEYPVIIKPSVGQGSKGFMKIGDKEELEHQLSIRKEEQVVCEYLPGEEYTVDCFTDRKGELRYISCRNRHRIRNGISVNSSMMEPDNRITEIAEQINQRIAFRGVWFFQLKRDKNNIYKLMECATRTAGTMCVERAAGVNLPLLTVFDAMGYDVVLKPQTNFVQVDRALQNVYQVDITYDEVYMDFDDTIIVHGRVNRTVLLFMYQCVERGIPIILLSRHETDIMEDLKTYKIAPELFSEIIDLPRSEKKIDNIHPSEKALFIDDSFAERKAMQDTFGIATLGVDAVEALLDYRQ